MVCMSSWLQYNQPAVRDLAWAIGSPPLIKPEAQSLLLESLQIEAQPTSEQSIIWPEFSWFKNQLKEFSPILDELDKNPAPLLEALKNRRSPRLGIYFESLLIYWLNKQQRFNLLHHNLPVREQVPATGHQITLGEFDLIVFDNLTSKTLHWEVAIKYYLGLGSPDQPANWIGPNKKDRLDLKLKHLINKQTRLSQHPGSKSTLNKLKINIDETWVILKGYLFYPERFFQNSLPQTRPIIPKFSASDHLKGIWQKASTFEELQNQSEWIKLDREQWLCPLKEPISPHLLKNKRYQAPENTAEYYAKNKKNSEIQRLFVIPDSWL